MTTHVGTPENAPPPGIEYLGSGYDIIYGNPLDEQGEAFLDPGFRLPAIELLFDVRRTAGSFQEPLGTSIKRGPACKYATLAQEVATVSAYQQLLALDVITLNEWGTPQSLPPSPPKPPPPPPPPPKDTDKKDTDNTKDSTSDDGGFVIVDPTTTSSSSGTNASTSSDTVDEATKRKKKDKDDYDDHDDDDHRKGRCRHKVGGQPPVSQPLTNAFVASFGFTDIRQSLEQKDQVAFYSRALCVEYMVEFRSFIPPLLTENFSNGIAFLPDFVPNESDLCKS